MKSLRGVQERNQDPPRKNNIGKNYNINKINDLRDVYQFAKKEGIIAEEGKLWIAKEAWRIQELNKTNQFYFCHLFCVRFIPIEIFGDRQLRESKRCRFKKLNRVCNNNDSIENRSKWRQELQHGKRPSISIWCLEVTFCFHSNRCLASTTFQSES